MFVQNKLTGKMKKYLLIAVMVISSFMAAGCGNRNVSGDKQEAAVPGDGKLHEFNVNEDFDVNAFNWFDDALLLCAGDHSRSNAMTIGWGGIGTLWRAHNVVTVYVARARYTKEFMDNYDYFTVMSFSDPEVLRYMGRYSGRDGDKAAALGLHTAFTENGTPYYEEADVVLECRTMYAHEFDPENFRSEMPSRMYEHFPAGLHTMYIGEVVKALKK